MKQQHPRGRAEDQAFADLNCAVKAFQEAGLLVQEALIHWHKTIAHRARQVDGVQAAERLARAAIKRAAGKSS